MKSKNFHFKLSPSDLLSELIAMNNEQRGEWITSFAIDLVGDNEESATTDLARRMIAEANEYRELKAQAGAKGGIAKASRGVAKSSTATFCSSTTLADSSIPLASSSSSNKESKNSSSSGDDAPTDYPPEFEAFWSAYPRKVGKGAAYAAFKKQKLGGGKLLAVIDAVEAHKMTEQWRKDGGQFIPNPSTWINQKRYDDGHVVPKEDDRSEFLRRRAATIEVAEVANGR